MLRRLGQAGVAFLLAAMLLYALDFAQWRLRDARGTGTGSIAVTRFTVAPLKGGKEEYYPDGTETVPCSHSLFPQTGAGACWWLARNSVVYER